MYHPGRPPAKPWRISRNYGNFVPDKMTSEKAWLRDYFRSMGIKPKQGNDDQCRREQRKQQRRLNTYLCRLDTPEWDE